MNGGQSRAVFIGVTASANRGSGSFRWQLPVATSPAAAALGLSVAASGGSFSCHRDAAAAEAV